MNNILFSSKYKLLLVTIILLVPSLLKGDDFNKYVGQSFFLPIPKSPASNGFVNSWSYSCSSTKINIKNRGNSDPSEAVITSYFDGTVTIECFFQYSYYINNVPRTGTSREYHRITCLSNNISISGSRTRLNVGETMQLSYKFSHNTYDADPQITWKCGSNVASVDYRGIVTALRSGQATITASSNLGGNVANYTIEVEKVEPAYVTIAPDSPSVPCDGSVQLYANVSPSGASQDVSWSIIGGSSNIATISSSGLLSGKIPGNVEVKATAENGVYGTSLVTVYEPSFNITSSSPSNNATSLSVFTTPSITFSHDVYKGDKFNQITLKNADGDNIKGTVSISGKTITFTPNEPLDPQTKYVLILPLKSIKNKWGTHYSKNHTLTFNTGNLEKLTLTSNISNKFIERGTSIKLACNKNSASIYYTLDGNTPTENSTKYQGEIIINNDVKLRAIAMQAGYENSIMLCQDLYISNVDIVKQFPDTNTEMYEYKDVNPYIRFSNNIVASTNISDVRILKKGSENIEGDIIVADSSIFFIPKQPLELGYNYQISIPSDAIKTWQGEVNKAVSWSFCTGDYANKITMNGPELAAAIKTDGTLYTWGAQFKSGNAANGSYTTTAQLVPSAFITEDIKVVSSGYMHHAIVKADESLWMWGRQYCGEFGNKSNVGTAYPIKVMENVVEVSCGGQSTAIVKNDGSLWMCGRNDFGQIGDNSIINRSEPIKIMDNVSSAIAGWCVTYAIKNDGSLWAWGRNDKHQLGIESVSDQLTPIKIMDNVAIISVSATEAKWATAIKTDGTLWVWGEKQATPAMILDDVSSVAVGIDYVEAIKSDGTLWAFGDNTFGQLGNNTTIASNTPIKIMDNVAEVASGGHTTMVNMKNGSVWAWGRNKSGLLGDGTTPSLTTYKETPVQIIEGRSSSVLEGVSSRKRIYTVIKGGTNVINALPEPIDAIYSEIIWTSKNPNVASISARGVIKGEAIGETDIITTIIDESGKEFTITNHVIVSDAANIGITNNNNKIRVWASNLQLHITGLQAGQLINVYNINSSLVYKEIANDESISIPVDNKGVYILRVGNYSTKILVH